MKSLAIIKDVKLTKAQKYLYSLICKKLKKEEKLTFEEAKKLYLGYVNRYMIEGVPHKTNYWVPTEEPGQYTSRLEPMTQEEIDWATSFWLTANIGRLVLKGYLQVMPMIELKKLS